MNFSRSVRFISAEANFLAVRPARYGTECTGWTASLLRSTRCLDTNIRPRCAFRLLWNLVCFWKRLTVHQKLSSYLRAYVPVSLYCFFVHYLTALCSTMCFRRLGWLLAINWFVTIIHLYAWWVRLTFIFNVHYFNWHNRECTNVIVFWKVHINFAEVGDGDVKRVTLVSVHDIYSPHEYINPYYFSSRVTFSWRTAFESTSTGISHIAFYTNYHATVILFG